MVKPLATILLLAAVALGAEDRSYEAEENYRPHNVTDLAHYIYGWRGSYYNGTTSFALKPKDWGDDEDDEVVCSEFRRKTVTFSYDTIVGIAQPGEDDGGKNPVMLLVKSYPKTIDLDSGYLWPEGGATNPSPAQVNDEIFSLESIEPKNRGYTDFSSERLPKWNLTTRHLDGPSYALEGTSNEAGEVLQMNMTHCDGTPDVWWGGFLMAAGDKASERVDTFKVGDPVMTGQFDDSSASFTIKGFFHLNTDYKADEDEVEMYGEITIDFHGKIDEKRSDRLLKGSKPGWEATVGFKGESVDDDDSGAAGLGMLGSYACALLTTMVLFVAVL